MIPIFVYGTLKSGHSRNSLLQGQRYLGTALTTPDYRMYRYSSFPALIEATTPGSGVCILGEVYEVDDSCLVQLDDVEGVKYGLFYRGNLSLQSVNFVFPPLFKTSSDSIIVDKSATAYFFADKEKLLGLKDCGANWTIGG